MAAVQEAMTQSGDPDEIRKMVNLPKYEKWRNYKKWLPQNVERIWRHFHMGL
ncbi:MAG: hypothetical protein V3V62_09310 [bacterium]